MNYQQMQETPTSSVITRGIDVHREPRRALRRAPSVYSTYVPNKRFSRYNNAFHSIIPFGNNSNDELAVQNCNPLCFLTHLWIWKYFWGSLKNNTCTKPPRCPKIDSSQENSKRLDGLLSSQFINQGKVGSSMLRVVLKFIRTRAIFASLLYISGSVLSIVGLVLFLPGILYHDNKISSNVTTISSDENSQALKYLIALICTEITAGLLYSGSVAINLRTAIRLRSACFASLFRQSVSVLLTYKLSSWQLVSFLLADGQHIQELVMAVPNLICAPIIILFTMFFVGIHLQLWGYLSVVLVLLFFPIFILFALLSKNLLNEASFFSEQRIILLEEYIVKNSHVKIMKEEKHFEKSISDNRNKELNHLKSAGFYDIFCSSFIQLQPVLSLCILFMADSRVPEFSAICIILLIHVKHSLDTFWDSLSNFIKGLSALNKYKNIMTLETVQFKKIPTLNDNTVVRIKSGSFQWLKEGTLNRTDNIKYKNKRDYLVLPSKEPTEDVLCDIDLEIKNGELIGVCGPPGSGKSSLLLSVMGLLLQSKGERDVKGRFAYVSQEPFIFNETLKNNIVLGREFNRTVYFRTTMHCGLIDEVANFYNNDDTIITSKNLTFQQKQKISLARALYSDSDIYLLDEPLSTIPFDKKMEMFDTCIIKSLQEKTRILVTDQTEFLEKCDVVYFFQNGTIICGGTHSELMGQEEYREFFQNLEEQKSYTRFNSSLCESPREVPLTPSIYSPSSCTSLHQSTGSLDSANSSNCPFKINEAQNITKQHAFKRVIFIYVRCICSIGCIIFLFAQIINSALISIFPVHFISMREKPDEFFYSCVYFGLFLVMLLMAIITNFFLNKKMMSTAVIFHDEMIIKLFNATLSFFQEMSSGIISTGLLYLHLTDIQIPRTIHNIVLNALAVLMTICLICLIIPWYLINVLVILLLIVIVTVFVRKALFNFDELTMKNCDRLYDQIVTVLSNRPIIQAYNRIHYFTFKLYDVYDEYICYTYIIDAGKYWLNYFLRTTLVILPASFIAICFVGDLKFCFTWNLILDDDNDREVLYLVSTICVFQICFSLHRLFLLYVNSGLLFDLTSRTYIFKESIPQEPKQNILEEEQVFIKKDNNAIHFYDVTFCIQQDSIPVLKDLTFTINSKEKIGFLKTSVAERKAIIAILYRLSNISFGNVKFGNYFFLEIPLLNLRSSIAIIPAEPYMFKHTIKEILISNNDVDSDTIVSILQKFSVFEYIQQLPNNVDTVAEKYLTAEQKQILLLIQAYVKQSPIIIVEDVVVGSYFEFILRTHIRNLLLNSTVIIFGNDTKCMLLCDRVVCIKKGKITKVEVITQNEHNTETIPFADGILETNL